MGCLSVHIPAKALSLPVNTTAPTSGSSSHFFSASLSSTKRALDSAFNAFGLFSLTVVLSESTSNIVLWSYSIQLLASDRHQLGCSHMIPLLTCIEQNEEETVEQMV